MTLCYTIHGVQVRVDSDWARLKQLLSLNCDPFRSDKVGRESLEISVLLKRKPWLGLETPYDRPTGSEEKWGSGIFIEGSTVKYRELPYHVEYTSGEQSRVEAYYLLDRRSRLRGIYSDVPAWGDCQRMMRLAVYLPLFHMLERYGWGLLHAAAVAFENRVIALLGLNGCGKSSLCFSMLDRLDYVSDNYLLWDGSRFAAFPEAVRLPSSLVAGKWRTPKFYGKRLVPVDREKICIQGNPHSLIFLTQGTSTSIERIPQREALRRLRAIENMTHEFPSHSYLGTVSRQQNDELAIGLAETVEAYALRISDVAEARDRVFDLL